MMFRTFLLFMIFFSGLRTWAIGEFDNSENLRAMHDAANQHRQMGDQVCRIGCAQKCAVHRNVPKAMSECLQKCQTLCLLGK